MHAIVQDVPAEQKASMLVVSEFVGCSPSLSGAIRVNPWNVDSVADGIYSAIKMPLPDRHLRHAKHWRYVSTHTAAFWVKVSCTLSPEMWVLHGAKSVLRACVYSTIVALLLKTDGVTTQSTCPL